MRSPSSETPSWHAAHSPDLPAIVMGSSGEVVTYAQLDERSARFARALRSRGIYIGDHIAILMENNRAFLEVAWAAQRSGLYYTAVNRHLRSSEVQYVLDDCGAVALVSSEAMADVVAGLDLTRVTGQVGRPFEYHNDPEKTASVVTTGVGGRSATWATSTRTATSASPTARRT